MSAVARGGASPAAGGQRRARFGPAQWVATGVLAGVLAFFAGTGIAIGGISPGKVWSISGVLVVVLVVAVVGLVVTAHQPRNPIGWVLLTESAFMLASPAASTYAVLVYDHGYPALFVAGPAALVLAQLFSFSLIGFPVVILLFPDGRLPSRTWRWVLATYLALSGVAILGTATATLSLTVGHHPYVNPATSSPAALGHGSTAWLVPMTLAFYLIVVAFWLAAVVHQALSWRHSTGERRQQLKWLASGAAVCGVFGIWAISTNSWWWEVLILGFAALPLGIGVGILKYGLYEIDRIISRTLAYAIVTGLLVGVYAAVAALAGLAGAALQSPIAVAVATLAAAALFNPLRRRVQQVVDRRFNRARYDADQMITAFAARLQDTPHTDAASADLLATVQGALEPAHVALWTPGGQP